MPSEWYNRKWLEILLASMLSLSNSQTDEFLDIEIDMNKFLKISNAPISVISKIGYQEPNDE